MYALCVLPSFYGESVKTAELRADLKKFAQKIERRAVALVKGDEATAALEQANIELAADEICQHFEESNG